MKIILKLLCVGIVMTLPFQWVWAGDEKIGPGWEKVFQVSAPSHIPNCIGFSDEMNGITVGVHGECHYTTDGGKTWPQSQNVSECRYGLDINGKTAWNCGNFGQMRVTHDGGQTWLPMTDCGFIGYYVNMINEKTGWVAGDRKLAITRDGGKSWATREIPKEIRLICAMSFLNENQGFLLDLGVGGTATIAATKDGGLTWATQKYHYQGQVFLRKTLTASPSTMRYSDADHGMVVTYYLDQNREVAWVTADGGKTWKEDIICDKMGTPYLSRDCKMLTILSMDNTVTVLRRK